MPQEVQPKFAEFLAGTDLYSASLATPAPLQLSYMQDAGADTVSVHDGNATSEDIPDDNFVQESVVHGCRAMPPKGPPSFFQGSISS
ncbi:hypothetical protein CYMTET_47262 [Cymbomonas tetramitiformis]|uniref:Uncharacterized protein n=1 Tax=Cymbomonas tetramitiformis TaxID=36881 RepID=A0AAE0EW58_9CHLO|nr:hypothetical protein CYMTET_47262 [Cymbomonas tetramitiformis]